MIGPLPANVTVEKKLQKNIDLIHFLQKKNRAGKSVPEARPIACGQRSPWISWPKGASKVATDLNENVVRQIGQAAGLVDVKVCAVDEIWSG